MLMMHALSATRLPAANTYWTWFSLGLVEGEGVEVSVTSPPGFDWEESFCRTLHWWSDHPTCGVFGHACKG